MPLNCTLQKGSDTHLCFTTIKKLKSGGSISDCVSRDPRITPKLEDLLEGIMGCRLSVYPWVRFMTVTWESWITGDKDPGRVWRNPEAQASLSSPPACSWDTRARGSGFSKQTRVSHSLFTKSKGRETSRGETRRESISVRPAMGRQRLKDCLQSAEKKF